MNSRIQEFYLQHKDKVWNYERIPESKRPSHWVTWESKYPWLKLMIDAPFKEMLEEAKNIKHLFVEHRTDYSQGWKSVCLHGIDDYVTSVPEDHGFSKDTKRDWTNASAECPITTNYFKNQFPFNVYDRVRFMLIEPGGYINPHVDGSRDDNPSRAVNMSLNNPDQCFLITENGIVPYDNDGSVFYFNIAYEHGVINNSNEDRYHIIVHGAETPEFEDIVLESYDALGTLQIGYYVINTEPVTITKTFEDKFDNYMGVCGGLKTYILLGQECFSENTNVIMFDISPAAIKWQQFLKETWNGEVEHFVLMAEMFGELHPEFEPIGGFHDDKIKMHLHKFLKDNNIDAQQLKKGWDKFQKMNVIYEQIDLFNTEDVNKLIQHTKLGTNTYFWLSNCFVMERTVFQHGIKGTWDLEISFRENFRSKSYTPCTFDVGDFIYI